jgi:hypothetical protein
VPTSSHPLCCVPLFGCCRLAGPALPKRSWARDGPPAECVTTGLVGCVELGVTAVVKRFSGAPFAGTGVRFRHPFFRVAFEDGDAEEYTGKQLAAVLRLRLGCFHLAAPRLPRRSGARNSMTADAPL